MTLAEAYQMKRAPKKGKKKTFSLKMTDGNLQLDENYNYFFEVQGQEGVSGLGWGDFALLTDPLIGLDRLFCKEFTFKKPNGRLNDYQSLLIFISATCCLPLLKIILSCSDFDLFV